MKRLAIQQFAPRLRDSAGNARTIAEAAATARADLLLTPELSLTGYDLGDDAAQLAVVASDGAAADFAGPAAAAPDVVIGFPELGPGGVLYNAAAHLRSGRVLHRHRKIYLPTYGMFDEMRFFGRGRRVDAYDVGGGWRVGLLVCEDLWHPALTYLLAMRGIDLLLVPAAAPGRGVWQGGEDGDRFGSVPVWERIVRTTAQLYGIYVALANRVGVEGGVSFAGGSLIVGPDGAVLARAPEGEEAIIAADLDRVEVTRCRRPYAHLRDEDPALTLEELRRLISEGGL